MGTNYTKHRNDEIGMLLLMEDYKIHALLLDHEVCKVDCLEDASSSPEDDEKEDYSTSSWPLILCAHALFFFGSFFTTIASTSNLLDAIRYSSVDSNSEDIDEGEPHGGKIVLLHSWTTYEILSAASTGMYLLNAICHICCCQGLLEHATIKIIFGLAAVSEFLSSILSIHYNPWPSYVSASVAVYLYLLSAILTIRDRKYQSSFSSLLSGNTRALFLGDTLFLAGSLIDVCINSFASPNYLTTKWATIASWSLVSSLLWFIDSFIYLAADVLENSYSKEQLVTKIVSSSTGGDIEDVNRLRIETEDKFQAIYQLTYRSTRN